MIADQVRYFKRSDPISVIPRTVVIADPGEFLLRSARSAV